MTFRDVLFALTTDPEPTPVAVVEDGVALAAALGARISGLAYAVTVPASGNILADLLLDIPALIAEEAKKSLAKAETVLATFQDIADKAGIFQERILERFPKSEISDVSVEYARLRDLTIVSLGEGDYSEQLHAEAIIFGSGRPTIVLPRERKGAGPLALDTVAVAWDFSRPATRAIADALPILKRAKRVFIVTVMNEKAIETQRSGVELAKHLARHGIDVVLDTADAAGRPIGDALESYVASCHADLLVMGAYGHSRIREFVLGGATRSMLERPPAPLFLSH
ncbi:universal stress protein [Methylocella tundrae]|uniref:Universal stress protein UspA n=1 Tax=Methylocella tundrae TaxID=227605 RepID=A0A4U8Z6G7_METTU|nr:universal stress protein [Methylocella tundrae]WPP03030.1 universal stress protein [Methylocella tundrae]VFU16241.1 Universal stress protein UspA [Methylocella tundrae]